MVELAEMAVSYHIPRSWVAGSVCPVCGDAHLAIDPQVDRPDQMVCSCCATAFEVAIDGLHVHLVRMPAVLPERVKDLWYRPGELHELAVQASLAQAETKAAMVAPAALSVEELRRRALELHRLGNPPERIRGILQGLRGARAGDVDLAMQEVAAAQDNKNLGRLRWATIVLAVIVVMVSLFAFLFSKDGPSTGNSAVPGGAGDSTNILSSIFQPKTSPQLDQAGTKAQAEDPFIDPALLPPVLQTAIPGGMKVLKPPEVSILRGESTGKIAHCPATVGDAVRLFGGEMKIWSKSRGGWTMISAEPQTIRIPEGMTAGYLVYITKPEFNSIPGPVTITNLNFLAISCE